MSTRDTTLLRRRDVEARTGLPRSTLYRRISEGSFPPPVSIGMRSVAWIEAEVDGWINERIERARLAIASGSQKSSSAPENTAKGDSSTQPKE